MQSSETVSSKPGGMLGIRHVALFVKELEACVKFYVDIMGMHIEWQPDADNVYLTNHGDVFALHRVDYDYKTGCQNYRSPKNPPRWCTWLLLPGFSRAFARAYLSSAHQCFDIEESKIKNTRIKRLELKTAPIGAVFLLR